MFVHVAYGGICNLGLRYVAKILARIPLIYGHHGRSTLRGRVLVEAAVKLVRIGRVGHHDRTVGRSAARDDEVGAGRGFAARNGSRYGESKCQQYLFHRFMNFYRTYPFSCFLSLYLSLWHPPRSQPWPWPPTRARATAAAPSHTAIPKPRLSYAYHDRRVSHS